MSEKALLCNIICPNRGKNEEFSPEAKAAIFALFHTGMPKRAVARQFKTDHRTVDRIIKRFIKTRTFDGNTRTGRPSKLNRTERRNILRYIRQDRFISWDRLRDLMDNSVSVRTIKRAVSFHYKRKWKSMDRPKLDKEKARIRLHFCQGWIKDIEELKEVCCKSQGK